MTEDTGQEKRTEGQQPASAQSDRHTLLVAGGIIVGAVLLLIVGNVGWLTADPEPVVPRDPPEIISMASSPERIMPHTAVAIYCEAMHPNGDEITYTWSASEGEVRGEGAEIEWIAPASEGFYRVFVTVEDGFGASVEESLSLRVRENRPPEIPSMGTDIGDGIGWVVPGARVYIWCEAEDPDGDTLSYDWMADAGDLFGEGPAVIWIAPSELGMHWITVAVDDSYGGVAERAIPVTVSAAEAPVIKDIRVEPADRRYTKPYQDSWQIFKGQSCSFEAIVEETDREFTYRWSAESGELSAEGTTAVWQAPSPTRAQWVTIVLQVSDAHGNEASDTVRMYVQTCPSCM